MVRIVLVSFFLDDHGQKCEAHPFGCGNAFIKQHGNGVSMLVRLRRVVEATHLAGYDVNDDGMDGCCVCLAVQEYTTGPNGQLLDSALLYITEGFLPDTVNSSMRALYYCNRGYGYEEIVEN